MAMEITISGSIQFGPSWNALERMIISMLDKHGNLAKISRRDGKANYHSTTGIYDLTFVPESGDAFDIVLKVNPNAGE